MGHHQRTQLILGSLWPCASSDAACDRHRVVVDEAMNMNTCILDTLERWVEDRRQLLASKGIAVSTTRGPADRNPAAVWVDFESATKAARLTVWSDGQADLVILDHENGRDLLEEHREITGSVGLDNAELSILAWLE